MCRSASRSQRPNARRGGCRRQIRSMSRASAGDHAVLRGPIPPVVAERGTVADSSVACLYRPVHDKEVYMDPAILADRLADERDMISGLSEINLPPMRSLEVIVYRTVHIGRLTKTVRQRVIASGPRPTNTKETQ